MTQIAFYVGQSSNLHARLRLACKLVEKAWARALPTHIYTDSAATSEQLDDLLWTYNDTSFIPHAIMPCQDSSLSIHISHAENPLENKRFLINLSNHVPEFFTHFERMAEVIDQEADILSAGRKRYQFYRNNGYTLDYHQL